MRNYELILVIIVLVFSALYISKTSYIDGCKRGLELRGAYPAENLSMDQYNKLKTLCEERK